MNLLETPRAGQYGVILSDPPWTWRPRSEKGDARSAQNHYPTMTLSDIQALPVADIAAPDCALSCGSPTRCCARASPPWRLGGSSIRPSASSGPSGTGTARLSRAWATGPAPTRSYACCGRAVVPGGSTRACAGGSMRRAASTAASLMPVSTPSTECSQTRSVAASSCSRVSLATAGAPGAIRPTNSPPVR